jgi:nucleotide-binding universal stress UspA family protein
MAAAEGAVVVGIDGSASAAQAARWAAAEAAQRGLRIHLVLAVGWVGGGFAGDLPVTQTVVDELGKAAEELLAEAAKAVREVAADVVVSTAVLFEPAVPALVELSREARLLVLGASGGSGFAGRLAGSTAVAVAAHAECPVVIVRGRADGSAVPPDAPVVVGLDGSEVSEGAAAAAFDEASWRGARLVAVHAWTDIEYDTVLAPADAALDWDAVVGQQERLLAESLAGLGENYPDVEVERVVVKQRPRSELLRRTKEAQLVVVGSRGRGGFRGLILGSTSQALIHYAECPVLIVRPHTTG